MQHDQRAQFPLPLIYPLHACNLIRALPLELDTNPQISEPEKKHDGEEWEHRTTRTLIITSPESPQGPGRKSSRLARRQIIRYSFPGWRARKLESVLHESGGPPIRRMQGGIRNLGMLFHIALRGGLWPIDRPSLPPSPCPVVTSGGELVVGGGGAKRITSWSNILSYELRTNPVQPLGLLFLAYS